MSTTIATADCVRERKYGLASIYSPSCHSMQLRIIFWNKQLISLVLVIFKFSPKKLWNFETTSCTQCSFRQYGQKYHCLVCLTNIVSLPSTGILRRESETSLQSQKIAMQELQTEKKVFLLSPVTSKRDNSLCETKILSWNKVHVRTVPQKARLPCIIIDELGTLYALYNYYMSLIFLIQCCDNKALHFLHPLSFFPHIMIT
jgi:hypothetical protein